MQKVRRTAEEGGFLTQGERVIAAVSGGADSMCLLDVLLHLRKEKNLDIRVVHVHHGIRKSADRDEAFVRAFCKERGVPFTAVRVDVPGYAKAHGLGLEEAARMLRYAALEQAARDWEREGDEKTEEGQERGAQAPAVRIALAHHLEDQAETVLFHLARGSGIAGLAGMRPASGRNIRPLLALTREEIESCLVQDRIGWVEDETNADLSYARNRIRHLILPELLKINAGAAEHLADTAREAAQTEDFLAEKTGEALARVTGGGQGPLWIDTAALLREPELLQRRAVYAAIVSAAGRKKDIGKRHVEGVLALAGMRGNGRADLPYGLVAVKQYGRLYLLSEGEEVPAGDLLIPKKRADYRMRIFPFPGSMEDIPEKKYTKWFDYDKISPNFLFRTREKGDYIVLSAEGAPASRKKKSIQRFMIDVRIPEAVRDELLLPASEHEILWVPGFRMSAGCRITETTKTVLEITAVGGEDGRDSDSPDSPGEG